VSLPPPAADRTALITGASSGIGKAIALELSGRGHQVVLVARSVDKLADVADGITASGGRAHALAADLSNRQARASLPARVAELGLALDILVNNAGLATYGPVAASDPEAELNMVEVDVSAVVDLCSRVVPEMVARRRGAVLNVASTGAFQPVPGQAGYGACKAFILSYTHSLSAELRRTGVTATALCPGPVDTGFGERAGFSKADAEAFLPGFMWASVESVAKTGVDALDKGQTVAIPGIANRAGAIFAHLVPKRLLAPMLARQHPALRR
jgi:short-subunit dehydrogenase